MRRVIFILLGIGAVGCGRPVPVFKLENLGERLFSETALSRYDDVSCASCHDPTKAFAQNEATMPGTGRAAGVRNPPSLMNVAEARVLTWSNPIVTTLEHQALVPLFGDNPLELGAQFDPAAVYEALEKKGYRPLFKAVFPGTEALYTPAHIAAALAAFERTLVSPDSPIDRFEAGERDALSPAAARGRDLFHSERLGCVSCHSGRYFSRAFAALADLDDAFAHNGYETKASGDPRVALGLAEFSGRAEDRGRFRIPSLRNVARTAPYMHDGGMATLADVVSHYEGQRDFSLNETERNELIAFLEALNDALD